MTRRARYVSIGACAAALGGLALYVLIVGWLGPSTAQEPSAGVTFGRGVIVIETARGPARIAVEIARTPEQRARGLMFRTSLAPDAGMLFLYETEGETAMWMKNTLIPLDMLFIAADGRVTRIAANTTPMSEARISSQGPVRAALELAAGSAARLGIAPGDRVRHEAFGQAP